MKLGLSLVVPVTGSINDCSFVKDFIQADIKSIDLNIFYLINSKVPQSESLVTEDIGIETFIIGSDRYFGSCEENISRIQDVSEALKSYVYIIGEHDKIIWENFNEALKLLDCIRADTLAVNIMGSQLLANGTYSEVPSLQIMNSGCSNACADVVESLFSGSVLDGRVAFPSMLSTFGPNDWAAFIGSHIFTRETLVRVLSYRFTDQVYSLTHANLAYQVSAKTKYALFEKCVAIRVSDEFLKMKLGHFQQGWLEDHRRVFGLSKYFWISHLAYINRIESNYLFNLLINCRTLAQRSDNNARIIFKSGYFISDVLIWSFYILDPSQVTDSFYLKDLKAPPNYYEMRVVKDFLRRFAPWVKSNVKNDQLADKLKMAFHCLESFLNNSGCDRLLIKKSSMYIWDAISLLPPEPIEFMHALSVKEFFDKELGSF